MKSFEESLSELLNIHSKENGSNTPDFLLAQYMIKCLEVYNDIVSIRDRWYGFVPFTLKTELNDEIK